MNDPLHRVVTTLVAGLTVTPPFASPLPESLDSCAA